MERNSHPKWEAMVSATLKNACADQIWAIYADFFNFHKYFPGLASCRGIHGTNGELGCIRIGSGFSISSKAEGINTGDDEAKGSENWSKERLIAIDHSKRTLSYEIVDSNIGFNSYVATVKIHPGTDDDDGRHDHESGCVVEWSFTVDPVKGWQLDDLKKKYAEGVLGLAKRIDQDAIISYV